MRQVVTGQRRDVEIYTAPLPSMLQAPSLLPSCLIPTSPTRLVTVLGLDKVGKGLGFLVTVVVVVVSVVRGANILHLVDAAALGAPLDGPLLGHLEGSAPNTCCPGQVTYTKPDDVVGIGRNTGAAGILLVAGRAHENGALHGSYPHQFPSPSVLVFLHGVLPRREASSGRMSKMSTPSILPRISRRSKPVACSTSVGTVPGGAPGPVRSSTVLISVGGDY